MPEIRNNQMKETVCIDTYRVLDSCRDKDCYENVRCYLTCYSQEIIERSSNVRAKYARVLWADIAVDSVPFNRGFYQLTIKSYVKIGCECCVSPGNIEEIEGICAVEKKVVLFGSEGNVSVFKSEAGSCGFCSSNYSPSCSASSNLPIAVYETVDPVILDIKVVENERPCSCVCLPSEIPENVAQVLNGTIAENDGYRKLIVSLGCFSVCRIERPAQYLVGGVEYSVPDKECVPVTEDDPCCVFRSMAFPMNEFYPPSVGCLASQNAITQSKSCSCGQ